MGRADHGYAVVGADDHCRRYHYCGGMAPQGRRSQYRSRFQGTIVTEVFAAAVRDQEADQVVGADAGLALHGAVPDASAARLLRVARSARAARAISPPRPKSARCSANCSGCGRPRSGRRSARRPLLRLIELGPGRGTMMADALRALRVLPPLYQSLSIHLVEINPVLREKQRATLSGVRNISWHDSHRRRARAAPRSFSPTNISTCCRSIRW